MNTIHLSHPLMRLIRLSLTMHYRDTESFSDTGSEDVVSTRPIFIHPIQIADGEGRSVLRGTVSSTILLVQRDGTVELLERSWSADNVSSRPSIFVESRVSFSRDLFDATDVS